MTEDEISSLLSELAGIDTHDINLRDHPDAYDAVETAVAPLLQDLAAHEASNRIKTENLETLREQNRKLQKTLQRLIRSFPTDSDLIAASWEEFEIDEAMRAYDAASGVLAEQCCGVCKTCGGSRVDPGGLPACRACTLIPRAHEPVCKGSYVWGNGCGKCSACLGEIKHHGMSDAPTPPTSAADAERLDALEAFEGKDQWVVAKGIDGFTVYLKPRHHATRRTLREAIDAASKGTT